MIDARTRSFFMVGSLLLSSQLALSFWFSACAEVRVFKTH
jgi:hypothetical protein